MLSFFDTVTAFQLCRVSHGKILTVSMWSKRMTVNHEPVCDNEWPPSAGWREGTFTLMFEKGLKAYAELAEKPREKGWKKRILIFVQCFSFYDELLKNLAICTS